MTGYESKRAAAQAKLDDDDTQVYQDHDDALTIAYQSGYYDGKKAAQPAQKPVAYLCGPDKNGLFGLPTADKACKDCFPVYRQSPQPAQEPVAWITPDGGGFRIRFSPPTNEVPLGWDAFYNAPPQRPWVELEGEEHMTQEALKRALDFVESINLGSRSASVEQQREVIAICKEALAHPPQRLWVGWG